MKNKIWKHFKASFCTFTPGSKKNCGEFSFMCTVPVPVRVRNELPLIRIIGGNSFTYYNKCYPTVFINDLLLALL